MTSAGYVHVCMYVCMRQRHRRLGNPSLHGRPRAGQGRRELDAGQQLQMAVPHGRTPEKGHPQLDWSSSSSTVSVSVAIELPPERLVHHSPPRSRSQEMINKATDSMDI